MTEYGQLAEASKESGEAIAFLVIERHGSGSARQDLTYES